MTDKQAFHIISPFDSERYIGRVYQVGPSRVQVLMPPIKDTGEEKEIARHTTQLANAHVGAYVVVGCGEYAIFGQLQDVQVRNQTSVDLHKAGREIQPVGVIELFTSIHIEKARVVPGVIQSPQIGDLVYSPSPSFVQFVVSGATGDVSREPVMLEFAQLPDERDTPINISPEKFFGRHCAILGATGGGKSWSLARLMEESGRHKSKVILIDATGEYRDLDRHTTHLHFGEDPDKNPSSVEVVLPYYHLTEQDLFAIFRPHGASQGPKLRAAMKSLKLAKVSSSVGIEGLIIKAHKPKKQYERSYKNHQKEIDSPYADFDMGYLTRQIENECVDPQRSSTEPDVWGGINAVDLANCMPLVARIHDILQSPNLAPIFKPRKKKSLLKEMHRFIRDDEKRILRINVQYLSFAYNAREIIANALGRHLFELAQKGAFRKHPLLLVLDEAHQFLNPKLIDDENDFPLEAFSLIAKEGRKYALNIVIATQRPRDIPEDVLSQMGTMIVHRLINDNDRAIVERGCGEVDRTSLQIIPTLAPGEAVLAGVDFPVPLHIRVIPPDCRPHSEGADYQKYWNSKR